jgi:hypothetical protein
MTRLLVGPLLRHVGRTDATVWVETDGPCEVEVLGGREHTWSVAGHHYALVEVQGLAPGSSTEYQVLLDGERAWPPLDGKRPPSRIRTQGDGGSVRVAFGSCRYGRAAAKLGDRHFDPDALASFGRELAGEPEAGWPDAVLMLGDQVYADETSVPTQRKIRAKRDIEAGAKDQVADFEEYTWLYLESWTDPDVRWLMSNIPSSMIFDDHDVRDDWNTSHSWRKDMQRTDWWHDRIVGGLASYWVYQHLGNLAPGELAENKLYQQVRTSPDGSGAENMDLLREFAEHADAEADGAKGTRWSFCRDFGRVRLVMVDSRCGRVLADRRSMISEAEFTWVAEQFDGDYDHLLVGTSLPWLLPRALHDVEAWDEELASGRRGRRRARFGEWLRRAGDLEHWAAFRASFDALGELIAGVGRRKRAPASICVLSGDVHHAYVAQARFPEPVASPVYQLTCSPLHNYVPLPMKLFFRVFWSKLAERIVRGLLRAAGPVPRPHLDWDRIAGPHFGNDLAEFVASGRHAETLLRHTTGHGELREVNRLTLTA